MIRSTKDIAKARKNAIKAKREVLWLDDQGYWHAATNRANTPHYAIKTEDISVRAQRSSVEATQRA